ncbi:MAG: UDP-N-acetylmuramate dehydrogenase [Oscillospiraceae bacterium]|nr:UDP-N-acetylmuramate dehydrogenase [Oscillospiraceae bacterium]
MIKSICERLGAEFLEQTPIAPYTSFKIGGLCDIVRVNSVELLRELLATGLPFRVLGRGSNVLISDSGLSETVLLMGEDFAAISVDGEFITAQAGAKLSDVCKAALEAGLTGLEFAYGIPASVGGAVCMNAGAYGGEMRDVIESCTTTAGTLALADLRLSYRHSIFCDEADKIITAAKFRLARSDRAAIKARMDEITQSRLDKQPLDLPSAGSTFKRPPPLTDGTPVFAAKLIDDCGLKGYQIGGAVVSTKHAGFIVNSLKDGGKQGGGATCTDVLSLIEHVRETVKQKTGITLETEVKIWNS